MSRRRFDLAEDSPPSVTPTRRIAMNSGLPIYVKRTHPQAIIPTKAHGSDAGWDLYACRDVTIDSQPFRFGIGIMVAIPDGYYGQIQGRSGLAENGVYVFPGVIDSGFRGELELVMLSLDQDDWDVEEGDKVAQLVILPVPKTQMIDVGEEDLPDGERGDNGFGSSDFVPGPQDPEFWVKKEESHPGEEGEKASITAFSVTSPIGVDDQDEAAQIHIGNHSFRVSGFHFNPDGSEQPTSEEENSRIAQGLADILRKDDLPDATEKPQDAPGQAEGPSKVESPQDQSRTLGEIYSRFLEILNPDRFSPGSTGYSWGDASHSFFDTEAMKRMAARDSVRMSVEEELDSEDSSDSVEAQRDYWKEQCSRMADVINEHRQHLGKVREELQEAQYRLSKVPANVSHRVYAALREAYLKVEYERDDLKERANRQASTIQALMRKNLELESQLADERARPPGNAVDDLKVALEDARNHAISLMSDRDHLREENRKLKERVIQSVDRVDHLRMMTQFRDELARVKLRLKSDQDHFDRGLKEASQVQAKYRSLMSDLLEVLKVIKPRYLEPAQWDVINTCFDALGKPSPFFDGSQVMPKLG
jgi:dUTP pyrophosphatase